jgi:predicted dehydrogenase
VAALEAGKHVIVEKPMATSLDDGQAMIDVAAKAGRMLLPAMLLRFDYRYAQLPDRLAEIGPVRNAYAYRNFDRALFEHYSRTHSFIENAIHDIDLLMWLIGGEVTDVHGFTRNTLGRENPDVNWGVLEFDSGALATLQTSWLYPAQEHRNLQWNSGLQLMCDGGVLEVRNDGQGFMANTESSGILLLDQTGWADLHGEPRGAFGAMLRHFAACLRGETSWAGATAAEALASMAVANRLIADAEARPTSVA